MTRDTLLLLQRMLDQQQLRVGDPTFVEVVAQVLRAKEELAEAIRTAEVCDTSVGGAAGCR